SSSKEIRKLANSLPEYFNNIKSFIDNLYTKYYESLGDLPPILQLIENTVIDNLDRIESTLGSTIKSFIEVLIVSLSKIITFILTPILTFYFLVDKDFFKKRIIELIPIKYRDEVIGLANKI